MSPTLAGFIAFVRQQGFSTTAIPDDSQDFVYAFNAALEIAQQAFQAIAPMIYVLMVYNLGTSNLVNFASDNSPDTTWSSLRTKLDIEGNVLGPVTSSSDEGTSVSVEVPDFVKALSLSDLQYIKDPWGRRYVAFGQRYNTAWGLT